MSAIKVNILSFVKKASVNLKFKAREYVLEINEASSTAVQSLRF